MKQQRTTEEKLPTKLLTGGTFKLGRERDSHAEGEGGARTPGREKHTGRNQHGCNRAGTKGALDHVGIRSTEQPVPTGLKPVVKCMPGGMGVYYM